MKKILLLRFKIRFEDGDCILINESTIKIWRDAVGSFCIVDYEANNESQIAKGKLESVSDEGQVVVRHLKNSKIFWIFDIETVKNSKFSPIKNSGDEDD